MRAIQLDSNSETGRFLPLDLASLLPKLRQDHPPPGLQHLLLPPQVHLPPLLQSGQEIGLLVEAVQVLLKVRVPLRDLVVSLLVFLLCDPLSSGREFAVVVQG